MDGSGLEAEDVIPSLAVEHVGDRIHMVEVVMEEAVGSRRELRDTMGEDGPSNVELRARATFYEDFPLLLFIASELNQMYMQNDEVAQSC